MRKGIIILLAVFVFLGFAPQLWAQEYTGINVIVKLVSSTGIPYARKGIVVYRFPPVSGSRITTLLTDDHGEARTIRPLLSSPLVFDCVISSSAKFSVLADILFDVDTETSRLSNPRIWRRRSTIPVGWSAIPTIEDGNKLVLTISSVIARPPVTVIPIPR
jgi:hypothetical protein